MFSVDSFAPPRWAMTIALPGALKRTRRSRSVGRLAELADRANRRNNGVMLHKEGAGKWHVSSLVLALDSGLSRLSSKRLLSLS